LDTAGRGIVRSLYTNPLLGHDDTARSFRTHPSPRAVTMRHQMSKLDKCLEKSLSWLPKRSQEIDPQPTRYVTIERLLQGPTVAGIAPRYMTKYSWPNCQGTLKITQSDDESRPLQQRLCLDIERVSMTTGGTSTMTKHSADQFLRRQLIT